MHNRYFLFFIILFSGFGTAKSQSDKNPLSDSTRFAFIKFKSKTLNLDTVKVNSTTKGSFKFYNTGKIPLIVKDVKSSCGCTVVSFNKKPVLPGRSGKIEFHYNSPHKPSIISKYLIVLTNTYEKNYMLKIKGVVVK